MKTITKKEIASLVRISSSAFGKNFEIDTTSELECVIKMDEKTAKAAFLLFDDYLDVCLNLDERDEFNCIREDKKAIKKALYKDEITEDEYKQKDSEIFWKYVQMVSVT